MSDTRQQLERVYAAASGGNEEVYAWLLAWHGWCHAIDDTIDEHSFKHMPLAGLKDSTLVSRLVDHCADGIVLCSSAFFRRHAETLGPLIASVFEQYRQSELGGHHPVLREALRLSGNQVVLAVAYIMGGRSLVESVGKELWPIVTRTQLNDHANPAIAA